MGEAKARRARAGKLAPRSVVELLEGPAPAEAAGGTAPTVREYPIPPALQQKLAERQNAVARAQEELRELTEVALAAMGVEGVGVQVEIHADPPRFRVIQSEG